MKSYRALNRKAKELEKQKRRSREHSVVKNEKLKNSLEAATDTVAIVDGVERRCETNQSTNSGKVERENTRRNGKSPKSSGSSGVRSSMF